MIKIQNGIVTIPKRIVNRKQKHQIELLRGNKFDIYEEEYYVPSTTKNIEALEKAGFNMQPYKDKLMKLRSKVKRNYPFLFDYQLEAVTKSILHGNLLIADDTGTGKTISSFAVAEIAIRRRRIRHVVIISPDTIKKQWAGEIKKFFNRKTLIIKGTKSQRKKLYIKAEKRRVIIINYDQAVRDFWQIYPLIKDNFLIIDEASILKNPKTQRNKSAKLFKPKNLLALTGTPIENKLEDGMVLGNIVQKDWMDMKFFKRNFCMFNGREFIGYKNTKLFGEMLAEISIRRTMKEVIKEMPKISVYERLIPINQSQKNLEIHISENLADSVIETYTIFAMIESDVRLINMSKAKTLAGLKVQLKDNYKDAKIVELMEIVDEESGDEKIVVFTRFKKMATLIKEELEKSGEKVILGTGSVKDKYDIRRKFKDEDYRILVATDAYSYGVDLYFATTLINFDVLWNPAKMKQRTYRVIRATSKKPIKIFNLITEGGTESYMYEVMHGKKCLFEKVVVERPKEHLMEYIQGLKKAR